MAKKTDTSDKGSNGGNDNFSFEITIPAGVRLTVIDIDGTTIEGKELETLSQNAVNGVIKGTKEVLIVSDKIYFEVDAVGEPNNEVSINLKYWGKDVFQKNQTFLIQSNRRGQFLKDNLILPK